MAIMGDIVSTEGIRVDTQKIEAVHKSPKPTYSTDMKSFLGLASYYKMFVDGFLFILPPLMKLT